MPTNTRPEAAADATSDVVTALIGWFDENARDLPWRRPGTTAWQVLISEVMLQQTPVARVLEPFARWMQRWPTPAALANEPSSAAVAAWGHLGYPRRALRLHEAATVVVNSYGGELPAEVEALRRLPGVGEYTAAAVASFGFGGRALVLDTNVRRVLGRIGAGQALPAPRLTREERAMTAGYLPELPARAARWAGASMEFGALVCTSTAPGCDDCPVRVHCRWVAEGRPANAAPRRVQPWEGTDRQCRGRLLDVVRQQGEVPVEVLLSHWHDRRQAQRCLAGLRTDGLVHASQDAQSVLL